MKIISGDEAIHRLKDAEEVLVNVSDSGVPVLRSRTLSGIEGFRHGFSTRIGGVSQDIYADMNVGLKLGDDRDKVLENYRLLGEAIGIDYTRISAPNQVHDTVIRRVYEEDAGSGIVMPLRAEGIDGQITDARNLPLIVYGADCVPIIFIDPVRRAVGTAHGGWKGTVNGIASKMVEAFRKEFGSDPKDIYAAIGPSAGMCCYEVDTTVAEAFHNVFGDNESIVRSRASENISGKYMINLWEANRTLLEQAGLIREHISVLGVCTICNSDMFHSHRASGGRRGLNCGIVMIG